MSLPKASSHQLLESGVEATTADLADYKQLAIDLKDAQSRILNGDGQLRFGAVPLGMGCSVEGIV